MKSVINRPFKRTEKKTMEHESDSDNCNWHTRHSHQRIGTGTGGYGIRGRVETIQTTALLRSARILRRVRETCSPSESNEKPLANAGVKNSQKCKIINIFATLNLEGINPLIESRVSEKGKVVL